MPIFSAWTMLSGCDLAWHWDLLIGADETGCLDYLRRLAVAEPRSLCHVQNMLAPTPMKMNPIGFIHHND